MGQAYSIWLQFVPPKSKFAVEDIPDMTGKVVIVTGANSGCGYETAKALLAKNSKVYIACRSQQKADDAIRELKASTTQGEAVFLKLDLSSLQSVKEAIAEFKSKEKKLDILFNNAGVMFPPLDQTTTEGYDLQFGTNVVGPFLLTKSLIPELQAAKGRIITTSSFGHLLAFKGLQFETFKDGPARKKGNTQRYYFQSKAGNVIVSKEFARRYGGDGIVAISCNPGNLKTELQRHTSKFESSMIDFILYPQAYGALTQLYAGVSQEAATHNGEYYEPWARHGKASAWTQDEKIGKDLWTWLEEQVKPFE